MKKIFTFILIFSTLNGYGQVNGNKKILIVATSSSHPLNAPSDNSWGCYLPEVADVPI